MMRISKRYLSTGTFRTNLAVPCKIKLGGKMTDYRPKSKAQKLLMKRDFEGIYDVCLWFFLMKR